MSKGVVLVSGATGYIGAVVVREFLDNGYTVRGTVRSLTKKPEALKHLQEWIDNGDPLELVEADLVNAESWDAACKGCDYVAHVASPFFVGCSDAEAEEKLFKPAKQGTLNVLTAALKNDVKRVVVTSSVAAVMGGRQAPPLLKNPEEYWTDLEKADNYSKSKTLAEKAAWEFVEEKKKEGAKVFDLCTVNPTLVFGPPVSTSWATSHSIPKRFLNFEMPGVPDLNMGTVDVRDVAKAHRLAMEADGAPGKRFIVQGQSTSMLKWARTLSEEFKPLGYSVPTMKLPYALLWIVGFFDKEVKMILPEIGREPRNIECKLAKDVLGLEFTDEKSSILEHAHAAIRLGVSGFKQTAKYKSKFST